MKATALIRIPMNTECSAVFHGGCECFIAELERLQARVKELTYYVVPERAEVRERKLDELAAENERLRAALAAYGDHDKECAWKTLPTIPQGTLPHEICDCGYAEALRRR